MRKLRQSGWVEDWIDCGKIKRNKHKGSFGSDGNVPQDNCDGGYMIVSV